MNISDIIKSFESCTDKMNSVQQDDVLVSRYVITDRIAVVRCSECRHYCEDRQCSVHPYDGVFIPDYFCASGEKNDI